MMGGGKRYMGPAQPPSPQFNRDWAMNPPQRMDEPVLMKPRTPEPVSVYSESALRALELQTVLKAFTAGFLCGMAALALTVYGYIEYWPK